MPEQLQHNRNFTEATATEINHNLVCTFIEVSAVYRFCYKPNLTVLKSCMMLSRSSIIVLCFVRDLFPRVFFRVLEMFHFQRLPQYSNLFTFSGLKWNKLSLDFALLASHRHSLRCVSQPVSRELCYLAETVSSFQGTFTFRYYKIG